jgi:NADH-quinone oxidoreductase subunit M
LWIFLAFFLAYAIKIPLIPFHTWYAVTKSACCRYNVASGLCLKWDCIVLYRGNYQSPFAAKEYMYIFISLGIAGVIYGSILALRQKT